MKIHSVVLNLLLANTNVAMMVSIILEVFIVNKTKIKSQYKQNKPQKDRQNGHITTVNLLSKETTVGSLLRWFTQHMSSSVFIPVTQLENSPLPRYLTQLHT
jgi:hypothetical protein